MLFLRLQEYLAPCIGFPRFMENGFPKRFPPSSLSPPYSHHQIQPISQSKLTDKNIPQQQARKHGQAKGQKSEKLLFMRLLFKKLYSF